jgi:hypothetical protein
MLIELVGFELRKAAYVFWLFSDELIMLVLGKDCLRVFAGVFLEGNFEPHWLLPRVFREGICYLSSIHVLSLI